MIHRAYLTLLIIFAATLGITRAMERSKPRERSHIEPITQILNDAQKGIFDYATIDAYIKRGGNIDASNKRRQGLIHFAARAGNTEILTFLL